jgi:hypothetical protein
MICVEVIWLIGAVIVLTVDVVVVVSVVDVVGVAETDVSVVLTSVDDIVVSLEVVVFTISVDPVSVLLKRSAAKAVYAIALKKLTPTTTPNIFFIPFRDRSRSPAKPATSYANNYSFILPYSLIISDN